MTVQETQIGEIRGPSGVAVVGLHLVPVRKQQPTPGAGSPLALEENGCSPREQGMVPQTLRPVEEVPIIGAGVSPHLHVPLDGGFRTTPQKVPYA